MNNMKYTEIIKGWSTKLPKESETAIAVEYPNIDDCSQSFKNLMTAVSKCRSGLKTTSMN